MIKMLQLVVVSILSVVSLCGSIVVGCCLCLEAIFDFI